MPFQQQPPTLGNQFADDRVLRSYLTRVLPLEMLREISPALTELGALAGGELYQLQLADRLNEPTITKWDAWGNRIDRVDVTPLWRAAERIAAEHGIVATAYEQKHGSLSRVHLCALAYLFTPSTDIYSCPLAMSDGAARTLLNSGNQTLIDHAVPHLTSRNPADFWTSGQWMTEINGSSPRLDESVALVRATLTRAESWLATARQSGQESLEAGARRFAMTLGRLFELALLTSHAQWSDENEADGRAIAAARRFAASGINLLGDFDPEDASLLFD